MWVEVHKNGVRLSRCTYRCVVLPDANMERQTTSLLARLNAPTGAWCSLTERRASLHHAGSCFNAPTGAWCSLTGVAVVAVVLMALVSMHLQVRGAP